MPLFPFSRLDAAIVGTSVVTAEGADSAWTSLVFFRDWENGDGYNFCNGARMDPRPLVASMY